MSLVLEFNIDGVDDPDAPYPVETVDELAGFLDLLESTYAPTGVRVLARCGPAGGDPELLFGINDLDHDDKGRAVIRWLPTGEYGAGTSLPDTSVSFDGSYLPGVDAVVTFSPEASRVTTRDVRDALDQYLRFGVQPSSVAWIPGDPSWRRRGIGG